MDKLGYVYFGIMALLALGGAISTITSPNPIRGALGLLLMILSIAGLYLSLHAEFLAVIQLIVYAGAIVVLFIFVIMILGPSATSPRDNRGQIARYGGAALFLGVGASALVLLGRALPKPKLPEPAADAFGTIDAFGAELFGRALVPFELASALLLVAIVGAVAVARGKHGELAEKAFRKQIGRASTDPNTPEA